MNVGKKQPSRWPWLIIPVGCLSILGISCGGLVFFSVFGVMQFIKSSEPYQHAWLVVRNSQEIQTLLGEPIAQGMFVSGTVKTNGASGSADLTFHVSGSEASAAVRVIGKRSGHKWRYSSIRVTPEDPALDPIELSKPVQSSLPDSL